MFMALLMQGSASAPPVPKMGPAPPVGDQVPIDGSIWILIIAAIIIGVYHFHTLKKKMQKAD
ncbi:PID-CTERM protein-sorting domain-containing protein [Nonlabens sp. Hel1_33_55]|uniref:PID-CTERM protein-sorting domain-containing protein n=1 Tax=Nonlabens sp. Hel1_33_55 TaxID=1336802 RepID=UPI0012FD7AE0|nr:hypothetical protein [Nonlabens sp. Hel1_33_55]